MEKVRKAQVNLVGALSHDNKFRKMEQNKPIITSNPAEIQYYQSNPEYSVTFLKTPKAEKPVTSSKARASQRPAAPVEEDDEDEDDEEDDEEDEDEDDGDDEGDDGDDEDTEDQSGPIVFKKADLENMTKPALAELAKSEFKLSLDESKLSKNAMIGAIIKTQIAKSKE